MPKIIINGKIINVNVTDKRLIELIEKTGAKKEIREQKGEVIKSLSAVDPYTIGIGIGAVGIGITWIIYRVSQSQKSEFKNKFKGNLQ